MGKKKRYIYTGDSYRQLALEPGDSERRRSNLFYRNMDDFKKRWVEV